MATSRFAAILALGVVGLGIAVLYFLYSAPDLAMTQILVETLTLVLFVLAFRSLPLLKEFSRRSIRIRDAIVSAVFGCVMCLLVLVAFQFQPGEAPISGFMSENSLLLANGRNVVNVILVDFRALDTLGEISVLAIAALGVLSMLKTRPGKEKGER
jgi:multicomponent Na+:H+ antiporter subunit A